MARYHVLVVTALLLALGTARPACAGWVTSPGHAGDGTIDVNGLPQDQTLTQLRAGVGGDNLRGLAPVFFFELPQLPSRDALLAAELEITFLDLTRATVFTAPDFNADLFGLGARNSPTILTTDYHDGPASGSGDALLAQGFVTPATSPGRLSVTDGPLLDYLRSLYNADGTPVGTYAVFRINADRGLPVGSGNYRGYEFASADHADAGSRPELRMYATPEPPSLVMLAAGLLTLGAGRLLRRKSQPC